MEKKKRASVLSFNAVYKNTEVPRLNARTFTSEKTGKQSVNLGCLFWDEDMPWAAGLWLVTETEGQNNPAVSITFKDGQVMHLDNFWLNGRMHKDYRIQRKNSYSEPVEASIVESSKIIQQLGGQTQASSDVVQQELSPSDFNDDDIPF